VKYPLFYGIINNKEVLMASTVKSLAYVVIRIVVLSLFLAMGAVSAHHVVTSYGNLFMPGLMEKFMVIVWFTMAALFSTAGFTLFFIELSMVMKGGFRQYLFH
jgi:hypothetical protein